MRLTAGQRHMEQLVRWDGSPASGGWLGALGWQSEQGTVRPALEGRAGWGRNVREGRAGMARLALCSRETHVAGEGPRRAALWQAHEMMAVIWWLVYTQVHGSGSTNQCCVSWVRAHTSALHLNRRSHAVICPVSRDLRDASCAPAASLLQPARRLDAGRAGRRVGRRRSAARGAHAPWLRTFRGWRGWRAEGVDYSGTSVLGTRWG